MMFGDAFIGLGLYLVFESENIGGCSVALLLFYRAIERGWHPFQANACMLNL